LQKDRHGNYILPPGGIEPEDIVLRFLVPPNYRWDYNNKKYFPFAAALPPTHDGPTTAGERQSGLPAHPDSQGADPPSVGPVVAADPPRAEAGAALLAELAKTRRKLSQLGDKLHCARGELLWAVRSLREAARAGPTLDAAEACLRRAEHCLGEAEAIAAALPPPVY
jgi:hypothetical protein